MFNRFRVLYFIFPAFFIVAASPSFVSPDIKDKTNAPALRAVIPKIDAITGWKVKITSPAAKIAKAMPNPAVVYYEVHKNINNKNRSVAVVFGDLLKENGAVVNAANGILEGGGGIDGAIHAAALVNKQDLMKQEAIAYKKLHKVIIFPTGSAMVTNSYGLSSNITMVVFAVGPQGQSNAQTDRELYSTIYNSLVKASEYNATSVSIPSVSTGIYGFPIQKAAELYFKAIFQYFADNPSSSLVQVRLTNNSADKVHDIGKRFIELFAPRVSSQVKTCD